MPLAPGSRLGPYELVEPLGAGGMGEVYKARDTRLNRFVALKVLSGQLEHDPEGRRRFEREARAVAAIEHPHICVLYDVSEHEGTEYLVMECLQGETLAARLRDKPRGLPLKEALQIATEIASALDAAHRRGIIHRDLKPANVMLTKTGVKLLDFGLAKLREPAFPQNTGGATTQAPLTAPTTLLGTLQYMSPEQIHGKEADARSDIFAFGCVLYEMLTGRRAFDGVSPASVIAAILDHDPPAVTDLQPVAPAPLNDLVRSCLSKDPDERWQSAADLQRALTWVARDPAAVGKAGPVRSKRRLASVLAAGTLLLAAGAFAGRWLSQPRADVRPLALSVVPPDGASLHLRITESVEPLALSPDGRSLAFVATSFDGERRLFVRPLDSPNSRVLAGTEGADQPFWSPDGSMIGFFARGKLKKIRSDGGEPQSLCPVGRFGGGAAWSKDGTIIFSPFFEGALYRIPSSGGDAAPLTTLNPEKGETHHFRPRFLPDGRHFLYQVYSRVDSGEYVGSLDSTERTRVIENRGLAAGEMGQIADYTPGYLVFVRGTTLLARSFDPDLKVPRGEPVRIAEGIARAPGGIAAFAASMSAPIVAYWTADRPISTRLTWFDRTGRVIGWAGPAGPYEDPALAPDGRRVAVQRWDTPERRSIWIIDAERGTETRFTTNPDDMTPLWSPDGARIVYSSARDMPPNLFVRQVSDDGRREERLFSSRFVYFPTSWSTDGRFILQVTLRPDTGYDIHAFDLQNKTSRPLAQTPFDEQNGTLSRDGRWIAYSSDETGRKEVYLRSMNGEGRATRISIDGGAHPAWRSDSRELFYVEGGRRLMSVPLGAGAEPVAGPPRLLFEARFGPGDRRPYEVSADGQRVLGNVLVDVAVPPPITVIVNWPALFARR